MDHMADRLGTATTTVLSTPTHPAPAPTGCGRVQRIGRVPMRFARRTPLARVPRAWIHLLAVSVLGLALWFFYGSAAVNQDTMQHLGWGRDLAGGQLPNYRQPLAPTPHPLMVVGLGAAALVGDSFAYAVAVGTAYVALAVLLWCVLMLGWRLFSPEVGVLAVAILLLSGEIALRGVTGQVDVAAAALVLAALLVEISERRRAELVLVLLLMAGLLRPEAWLVSGAYWLYWMREGRSGPSIRQTALAFGAPVLWVLSDLVVTGDPVFSARLTHGVTEALDVPTGIEEVPSVLRSGMDRMLGPVMLIPATAGLVIAVMLLRERVLIPAGLAIAWLAGFVGLGLVGLPLLERFLFLPGALLSTFAVFALVGHFRHGSGRLRWGWAVCGLAVLALVAARDVPRRAEDVWRVRAETRRESNAIRDLRALAAMGVASPTVERCGRLVLPNNQPAPWVAQAFDVSQADVVDGRGLSEARGAYLWPAGRDADALIHNPFYGATSARRALPRDARLVASERSWSLYEFGCP